MSELGESLPPLVRSPGQAAPAGLMGVLEERVQSLVDRFRDARKTIEELQGAVEERDAQLANLKQRTGDADKLRRELKKRVNRLLDQVRELEKSHAEDRAE